MRAFKIILVAKDLKIIYGIQTNLNYCILRMNVNFFGL